MIRRIRTLIALVSSLLVAATTWSADPCEPRILRKVFDTGTLEQGQLLGKAKERLLRIQDRLGQDTWNRVANDCIDLIDPNVGTLEKVTIHDWVKLTVNTEVTDDEIVAVIRSVNGLRDSSGLLHIGILRKSGVGDGSRRWQRRSGCGRRWCCLISSFRIWMASRSSISRTARKSP